MHDKGSIITEICKHLADGRSIRTICQMAGMPNRDTLREWRKADPELDAQLLQARQDGCEVIAEEMFEIADDGINDYMVNRYGNKELNRESIERSKTRIDVRKWYLSKINPQRWSERSTHVHQDPEGKAPAFQVIISAAAEEELQKNADNRGSGD